VLERDREPIDKVRGEFMAPWGVAELKRLGLFDNPHLGRRRLCQAKRAL
jgi:hypothetical protein